MLYLKPANIEDIEKEHAFVAAEPADENGFLNNYHGVSFEDFRATVLPRIIDFSFGKNLPECYVPETFYFLWSDEGNGYCTQGLKLLIEEARKIVPENELYLHCNIDNPASLRVMIKNGGVIHHKDQDGYFVRIKLRG